MNGHVFHSVDSVYYKLQSLLETREENDFFHETKILDSESDYTPLVSRRILMYLISLYLPFYILIFQYFASNLYRFEPKQKRILETFRNLFYRYYYIFIFVRLHKIDGNVLCVNIFAANCRVFSPPLAPASGRDTKIILCSLYLIEIRNAQLFVAFTSPPSPATAQFMWPR